MEHIIIQLYVPAIGENFDLKIPLSMMILELVKLLGQAVETLSNGRYCASGTEILCLKNKEQILDYDQTPQDYGMQNGDLLMMM